VLANPGKPCLGVDYSGTDVGMCSHQSREKSLAGRIGHYAWQMGGRAIFGAGLWVD